MSTPQLQEERNRWASQVERQLKELIAGYHQLLDRKHERVRSTTAVRKNAEREGDGTVKLRSGATTSDQHDNALLPRRSRTTSRSDATLSRPKHYDAIVLENDLRRRPQRSSTIKENESATSRVYRGVDLASDAARRSSSRQEALLREPFLEPPSLHKKKKIAKRRSNNGQTPTWIVAQMHTCTAGGKRSYCAACAGVASRSHVQFTHRAELRDHLKWRDRQRMHDHSPLADYFS